MEKLATVLRDSDDSTTSIESAMARTNVSAQEISAEFGGSRQLLVAMVSELSESMSAPLTAGAQSGFKQGLLEFGQRVMETYATSHLRGLYRIAITESIRHTGLGRDFQEAGPGRLSQRLTDFLQIAQAEGALRRGDPHLLAGHFLALLRANVDMADTFPSELATSPVARARYVRNVVDLFCDGINRGRAPC
jgi:hypothetical protein